MTDDDGPGMAPPGQHAESDRSQCTSMATTSGKRCGKVVVPGLDVCHLHLGESDTGADRSNHPVDDRDDSGDELPVWERHAEEILGEGGRRRHEV